MKRVTPIALLAALAASGPIQAGDDALIDYRQQAMKAAAGHLRAAKGVAVEGVRLPGHLEAHAHALAALPPLIPAMFPRGSGGGESDAKPELWSDWDGFLKAAESYGEAAEAFQRAAAVGGKAAGEAYYRVQEACKGCHKRYRER